MWEKNTFTIMVNDWLFAVFKLTKIFCCSVTKSCLFFRHCERCGIEAGKRHWYWRVYTCVCRVNNAFCEYIRPQCARALSLSRRHRISWRARRAIRIQIAATMRISSPRPSVSPFASRPACRIKSQVSAACAEADELCKFRRAAPAIKARAHTLIKSRPASVKSFRKILSCRMTPCILIAREQTPAATTAAANSHAHRGNNVNYALPLFPTG